MWNTIANQRLSWRGTIVNRMKNGILRDCESTIFPIIGTHGKIVNFVNDVTERNLKDRLFLMQIQHLSRTITDFKDFFKPDKQTSITNSTVIVSKAIELIEHTRNLGRCFRKFILTIYFN